MSNKKQVPFDQLQTDADRLAKWNDAEARKKALQDETRELFLNFYLKPQNQVLISNAHGSCELTDKRLWCELFKSVNGRYPRNSCDGNLFRQFLMIFGQGLQRFAQKSPVGVGNSDPLWADLLDEDKRDGFMAREWAMNQRKRIRAEQVSNGSMHDEAISQTLTAT